MKILIICSNPQLKILLHQTIEQLPFDVEYISYKNFQNYDYSINNDLIIFDIYQQSEFEISVFIDFFSTPKFKHYKLLGLLSRSGLELREKLLVRPLTHYLIMPIDELDLTARIQQIFIPDIISSFELIFKKQGTSLIPNLISEFQKYFPHDNFFIFKQNGNNELQLLGVSDTKIQTGELSYSFSDIPQLGVYLDQLPELTNNSVAAEHPLKLFFTSVFNLTIHQFFIYKEHVEPNTNLYFFIFRKNSEKFKFWELDLLAQVCQLFKNYKILEHKTETLSASDHILTMLNSLNFGIISIDSEHRITFINQPAMDLMLIKTGQIFGKYLKEVIGEINYEQMFSVADDRQSAYERPEIELRLPDGEKILIGYNLTYTQKEKEDPANCIISLKDITYSKEMQEEMKRLDRLASLGVMASGIAHEIRNPLAGIKAIAQTFEEELNRDDPKHEFVRRIVRQVNRLDDMLRTLFSYAKPPKPNRNFFKLNASLNDVLGILTQKIQQQNIQIIQKISDNLPDIFADSGQVQQILFNLILNSIEAMDKSGQIAIHISPLANKLHYFKRKPFYEKISSNSYILFHLKDEGKGMSRSDLNQIFNPFFTTKTFGTGLGLSIVYQIVKENDGIIYFESEVGIGTDCFLILPTFDVSEIKGHK